MTQFKRWEKILEAKWFYPSIIKQSEDTLMVHYTTGNDVLLADYHVADDKTYYTLTRLDFRIHGKALTYSGVLEDAIPKQPTNEISFLLNITHSPRYLRLRMEDGELTHQLEIAGILPCEVSDDDLVGVDHLTRRLRLEDSWLTYFYRSAQPGKVYPHRTPLAGKLYFEETQTGRDFTILGAGQNVVFLKKDTDSYQLIPVDDDAHMIKVNEANTTSKQWLQALGKFVVGEENLYTTREDLPRFLQSVFFTEMLDELFDRREAIENDQGELIGWRYYQTSKLRAPYVVVKRDGEIAQVERYSVFDIQWTGEGFSTTFADDQIQSQTAGLFYKDGGSHRRLRKLPEDSYFRYYYRVYQMILDMLEGYISKANAAKLNRQCYQVLEHFDIDFGIIYPNLSSNSKTSDPVLAIFEKGDIPYQQRRRPLLMLRYSHEEVKETDDRQVVTASQDLPLGLVLKHQAGDRAYSVASFTPDKLYPFYSIGRVTLDVDNSCIKADYHQGTNYLDVFSQYIYHGKPRIYTTPKGNVLDFQLMSFDQCWSEMDSDTYLRVYHVEIPRDNQVVDEVKIAIRNPGLDYFTKGEETTYRTAIEFHVNRRFKWDNVPLSPFKGSFTTLLTFTDFNQASITEQIDHHIEQHLFVIDALLNMIHPQP